MLGIYATCGSEGGEEFVQEEKTAFTPDTEINTVLATDCGSTTTKAILIEKVEDEYRLIVRGEAPTTVEAPFEDVTTVSYTHLAATHAKDSGTRGKERPDDRKKGRGSGFLY